MESGQITDELQEAEMSTVQRIANELLCTERTYVRKLYLIDQVTLFTDKRFIFWRLAKKHFC